MDETANREGSPFSSFIKCPPATRLQWRLCGEWHSPIDFRRKRVAGCVCVWGGGGGGGGGAAVRARPNLSSGCPVEDRQRGVEVEGGNVPEYYGYSHRAEGEAGGPGGMRRIRRGHIWRLPFRPEGDELLPRPGGPWLSGCSGPATGASVMVSAGQWRRTPSCTWSCKQVGL